MPQQQFSQQQPQPLQQMQQQPTTPTGVIGGGSPSGNNPATTSNQATITVTKTKQPTQTVNASKETIGLISNLEASMSQATSVHLFGRLGNFFTNCQKNNVEILSTNPSATYFNYKNHNFKINYESKDITVNPEITSPEGKENLLKEATKIIEEAMQQAFQSSAKKNIESKPKLDS